MYLTNSIELRHVKLLVHVLYVLVHMYSTEYKFKPAGHDPFCACLDQMEMLYPHLCK